MVQGQTLAYLDDALLRAEVPQAKANVAHAEASLVAARAAAQLAVNTERRMRRLRETAVADIAAE